MRFFTLSEATDALPHVEPLLRRAVEQRQRLAELEDQYNRALEVTSSNGHSAAEKLSGQRSQLDQLANELRGTIADIQRIGCVIKDLRMGLVDFPSDRDGSPINLCWRLGEQTIAFWHTMDTGFDSRQPL